MRIIGTTPEGATIKGWPSETPGLSITRAYMGHARPRASHKGWRVTHTLSLLFVCAESLTYAEAKAFAAMLSHCADWTQPSEQVIARVRPKQVSRALSFIRVPPCE
jgi:hypothetical protein